MSDELQHEVTGLSKCFTAMLQGDPEIGCANLYITPDV
jgi:hypothetical protein